MPHFRINQRCIPRSKMCGFHRNGVRHAPFWCAPYSVFLCGLCRFMQLTDALIGLVNPKEQETLFPIDEFNTALEQVLELLERLNRSSTDQIQSRRSQVSALNDTFLSSVKIAVKPGLKINQQKD